MCCSLAKTFLVYFIHIMQTVWGQIRPVKTLDSLYGIPERKEKKKAACTLWLLANTFALQPFFHNVEPDLDSNCLTLL